MGDGVGPEVGPDVGAGVVLDGPRLGTGDSGVSSGEVGPDVRPVIVA